MKIENCKLPACRRVRKIANKAFTPAPKHQARRELSDRRIFLVRGFTLIEIMVAIGIVGILAAVVLTTMSSYGKRARASRALAQASSVIPSLVSCAGNGGTPNLNGTGDLCSLSSSYGSWPTWPSSDYGVDGSNWTSSSNWYFKVKVESGMNAICCNSKMNSCGQPATCDASATW